MSRSQGQEMLPGEDGGTWRLRFPLKLVASMGEDSSLYPRQQRLSAGGKEDSKLLKGKRIRI